MPLATSTSTLPQMSIMSLDRCSGGSANVSPCLDHLYMPHGKYSRFFGQELRCLGKGVILRAGRATTSYLSKATLGAQAIAVVSKIWNIWDGFHKELYLYGHPLHLRPLQGLCVPCIIGVFRTSEGLANMAMEPPHPHAWRVADRLLSRSEKSAIVDAYAQIHARGVLHGDVALRHILIGRDGKPTIINFRQASCLPPAMKIGLGGCSTHEFQLEMRKVKFLLDYQGAREFEYRLARERRSAARTNIREAVIPSAPFPISETTLQQWDASTIEDLTPPSLPFYVPNAPDISIRPMSWILGDFPLSADELSYADSEGDQLHISTSPEIAPIHGRFSEVDDNLLSLPPISPSRPSPKGKQREHDANSDVVGKSSHKLSDPGSSRTEEVSPNGLRVISESEEQEQHEAEASYVELTTVTACFEPGTPHGLRPTAISSEYCRASWSPDHCSLSGINSPGRLSSPSPLRHDVRCCSPLSWAPISFSASPSFLGYALDDSHLSCLRAEEAAARYELTPQLDYTSDSPSDTSVSTTDTPYGWTDSELSSPEGALVTLQDDVPPFPSIDNSDAPLLFDPSSDANIEFTGAPLETLRPSCKTRERVTTHYKRKRLFVAEENEYGERPRKQRCIEQ